MTSPLRRPRWRILALLAAVLVLSAGALTSGVPTSDAQEATPGTPGAELAWDPCGDGAEDWECSTLSVPRDYADPNGVMIDLALTRLPASDPARRIGALVFNAGGPGGASNGFLHQVGMQFFPDEIRARFDVVGFDPRGIGDSGQIDCKVDFETYYALDPSPDDAAEQQAWLDGGRDYAAACAANGGDLLPFVGSENVVSDMEQLREALGEEQLSFLGLSYGTSLGARYADRYPDRVRAFALDSALPSFIDPNTFVPEWVANYERAFDVFLDDCAAALTCAFHAGGDPGGAFDALLAGLDRTPLEVTTDDGTRLVGQHALLDAVDAMLSEPNSWAFLANALAAAAQGDGAAVLALADQHNDRQPDGSYGPGSSGFLAVSCLDFSIAADPATYEALAAKAAQVAPRLGAYYGTWVLPCVFWPAPPTPAAGPPVAAGAAPILVVGATFDTQDPYQWSVDMVGQLESGVLLTREGNGHPSYLESKCVEDAVNAYLLELTLPAPGLVCSSAGGLRERFS
jgi:pimeloyl-ACP methyl ester carboxylesterase